MKYDSAFWAALDRLAETSAIVIDRPKGSRHPRYPDYIYPLDYGYLDNTASMDGSGIDVWLGTRAERTIDAMMCIVDLEKRDSEIKLLIGCTDEETDLIYENHNATALMKGILIRR